MADSFSSKKDKIIIGKVDGDSNRKLSQKLNIKGFPTLLWFDEKSTEPAPYEGRRDLDSLTQFITEKTKIKSSAGAAAGDKQDQNKLAVQLNDRNFEEIVMDQNKDVLVEL